MAYEKDIKDLIAQMQRQQAGYGNFNLNEGNQQKGGWNDPPTSDRPMMPPQGQGGINPFQGSTDQSPHLMGGNPNIQNPDQTPPDPVNSVRPMGSKIGDKPPAPKTLSNAEGACPQCGTIHPPIPPGQKCPMANIKVKTETGEEKEIDVNKFMAQLKNIIISQSEQRRVKDIEKLFKNIIVEVTKYLEEYSE
jgi:hypothetical protein